MSKGEAGKRVMKWCSFYADVLLAEAVAFPLAAM